MGKYAYKTGYLLTRTHLYESLICNNLAIILVVHGEKVNWTRWIRVRSPLMLIKFLKYSEI